MLGASPLRVWREVDLPMVRPGAGWSRRASPSPSRSASSAPRCSSPGPTIRRCRWPSRGLLGARRGAQLRAGDGAEHDADAGVRGAPCWSWSASAPRPFRRVHAMTAAATGGGDASGSARGPRAGRAWIWRSPSTRSCACWARAAAASPRCCGWSPGCSRADAGRVLLDGRDQTRRARPPARGGPDVPGPPALPAARRGRQRRLRAADARGPARRARTRRVAELLDLVGLPGRAAARGRRAVRRRAAAGRAGPGAGPEPAAADAGRAARPARPRAARAAGGRTAASCSAGWAPRCSPSPTTRARPSRWPTGWW